MTDDWGHVCSCIALNHPLHKPRQCDEPPIRRGGICHTCTFALSPRSQPKEEHRKGANP